MFYHEMYEVEKSTFQDDDQCLPKCPKEIWKRTLQRQVKIQITQAQDLTFNPFDRVSFTF